MTIWQVDEPCRVQDATKSSEYAAEHREPLRLPPALKKPQYREFFERTIRYVGFSSRVLLRPPSAQSSENRVDDGRTHAPARFRGGDPL